MFVSSAKTIKTKSYDAEVFCLFQNYFAFIIGLYFGVI